MIRRNPFNVLARLRSIDEKMARASLANTQQAHERARRKLEELKDKHLAALEIEEILGPAQLRSLQLRGISSYEMLTAAAHAVAQSERAVRAKAEAWRRTAADLDAAERLEEKKNQEIAQEAAKSAEKAMDDLMGMLHARIGDGLI
jgi:flagellar biosynthesis chaperone FliJ